MNRCYPHPLVAREGWRIISVFALLTLFFIFSGSLKTAGALFFATLLSAHLFRDRVRNIPSDRCAVLSPADGRITSVEHAHDPHLSTDALKISIKTRFWHAYALRSPLSGSIVEYAPNRRRHILHLRTREGADWTLVQHRGDCDTRTGSIMRGERIGFARFGGRADIYLPANYTPHVAIGDRVKAGSTVLAKQPENAENAET